MKRNMPHHSFTVTHEPRREKTGLRGFPTKSHTNQAVKLQKMARGLKIRIWKEEGLYYLCSENKGADQLRGHGFRKKRDCTIYVAKTKALISFAVTAQLICVFLFTYATAGFLMTLLPSYWAFEGHKTLDPESK